MLIINPLTDESFSTMVHESVRGASNPDELQSRLRARYPRTVVRSRDLSGETKSTWYVYRDGSWTAPDAGSVKVER